MLTLHAPRAVQAQKKACVIKVRSEVRRSVATAFLLLEIPIPSRNSTPSLDTLLLRLKLPFLSLSPHALPVCCFRSPSNGILVQRRVDAHSMVGWRLSIHIGHGCQLWWCADAWLASAARCSEQLHWHPVRWAGFVQSQLLCGLW